MPRVGTSGIVKKIRRQPDARPDIVDPAPLPPTAMLELRPSNRQGDAATGTCDFAAHRRSVCAPPRLPRTTSSVKIFARRSRSFGALRRRIRGGSADYSAGEGSSRSTHLRTSAIKIFFPDFMIPDGSRAHLMARIAVTADDPYSISRNRFFPCPIACSPVHVPSIEIARFARRSANAFALATSSRSSIMTRTPA